MFILLSVIFKSVFNPSDSGSDQSILLSESTYLRAALDASSNVDKLFKKMQSPKGSAYLFSYYDANSIPRSGCVWYIQGFTTPDSEEIYTRNFLAVFTLPKENIESAIASVLIPPQEINIQELGDAKNEEFIMGYLQ